MLLHLLTVQHAHRCRRAATATRFAHAHHQALFAFFTSYLVSWAEAAQLATARARLASNIAFILVLHGRVSPCLVLHVLDDEIASM